MRIEVGIHEDIVLQKVPFDEKGRLVLYFRDRAEVEKTDTPASIFASMNAAEVVEEEGGNGLIMWTLKLADKLDKEKKERTAQQIGEMASNDALRLKNQLQQILEQYMPKDQIKWSMFDGTGVQEATYYEDLGDQNVLDMIYKNLTEQFVAQITPFLDRNEDAVRLKLARQSKDKHFARLPDRYIKDNPFIERMDVPKEQSKVKWTKYEIANGLNDGTPVSKDTADKTEPTPDAPNVFGQR